MLGLSQAELGNALGVSFQQIQKYEKGAYRVSASRLEQIASFLGVPISFFFNDLSISAKGSKRRVDGESIEAITKFATTSDGLSLAKAFMQIQDPKLRRCIVRLVEGIVGHDE